MQVSTACACQDLQMRQPALADSNSCLCGVAWLLSAASIHLHRLRQPVPAAAVHCMCSTDADSRCLPRTPQEASKP